MYSSFNCLSTYVNHSLIGPPSGICIAKNLLEEISDMLKEKKNPKDKLLSTQ